MDSLFLLRHSQTLRLALGPCGTTEDPSFIVVIGLINHVEHLTYQTGQNVCSGFSVRW